MTTRINDDDAIPDLSERVQGVLREREDYTGPRMRMHPEALESLAHTTAQKQAADSRMLNRVDDNVKKLRDDVNDIKAGKTEWQLATTSKLAGLESSAEKCDKTLARIEREMKLITGHVQVLQWTKVAMPLVGAFFAGGFVAYVVVHLVSR